MSVIGPIDLPSWRTLLMLKDAVKTMRDVDAEKYRLQIEGDKNVFKVILDKYRVA